MAATTGAATMRWNDIVNRSEAFVLNSANVLGEDVGYLVLLVRLLADTCENCPPNFDGDNPCNGGDCLTCLVGYADSLIEDPPD